MEPDTAIRRGKIGGKVSIVGQDGASEGPAGGWEEILRVTDVTAGTPVTRAGGQANSDTHTIFSAYVITAEQESESPPPPPRVHLRIEVADGNDAGSAKEVYRVLAGAPVTVSGSFVSVAAQLFSDEVGIQKAPPGTKADVSAFVSIGAGEDIQPTLWPRTQPSTGVQEPPLNSFWQVSIGPGRVRALQGFSTSLTDTYVMLFDWPGPNALPPNGTTPLWTFFLPAGATFTDDFIESARTVSRGFFWACSSAPDVFAYDGTQAIRMDVEMYAQDQLLGSI